MKPRQFWLQWEVDFLRRHYADALTVDLAQVLGTSIKRVLAKANAMGLHKSIEVISATARERTLRPDHGSRRTQIKPGQAPWNKGKPGSCGTHPHCRATQFKPGMRPHTWVPIGSHRVVDGIVERKTSDEPGTHSKRWTPVTRLVWQAAHGPVPEGHSIVFRAGQRTTNPDEITVDKLECLSRQQLMHRNSYHTNLPPELARVVQLRGVLSRAINQRTKDQAA